MGERCKQCGQLWPPAEPGGRKQAPEPAIVPKRRWQSDVDSAPLHLRSHCLVLAVQGCSACVSRRATATRSPLC